MPEGPELHLSSQFINAICKGRIFSGTVRKNPIHKCADVVWDAAAYTISSVSRGKELKVFLQSLKIKADEQSNVERGTVDSKNVASGRLHLLFNFGMSGKFEFTPVSKLPKHAHLSFFTKTENMALSFVDYRRFGKWQIGADWSPDRGPCVMFEYPQFRLNVLNNLADSAFNKPVCEVLLNQKYFNGIGNYLRAEICYRAGVRPFDQARAVFSDLPDVPEDVKEKMENGTKETGKVKIENGTKKRAKVKMENGMEETAKVEMDNEAKQTAKVKMENGVKETAKAKTKTARPDILELCSTIPLEVVGLGTSLYLPEDEDNDMSKFSLWLQCYYKPGMKNVADHNKRTMWYHSDPGPMLPREGGSKKRHAVYDKKLTKGGKKMKKEEDGYVEKKQTNDANTEKVKKHSKPSKEDTQRSPVKHKRITRTSLKTLVDESTKPSKKAAKLRKASSKKSSSKTADGANIISGKKTLCCEETQSAVKKQAKRRATRTAVKTTVTE